MVLSGGDLKFLASGAANIGGDIGGTSGSTVINSSTDMFFDAISGAQSKASQTDYRLMYLKNTNGDSGTVTAYQVKIYATLDTSIDQSDVGLEWAILPGVTSGVTAIASDTTEPTLPDGVSFVDVPVTEGAAHLAAAELAGGDAVTSPTVIPIWLKRIYTANSARPAKPMVTCTFKGFFDTVEE